MAIDTAAKRASVFDLPALQVNPFPTGITSASSRAHMSDEYAGIHAVEPPTAALKWVPEIEVDPATWRNESLGSTDIWVKEKEATSPWVKEIDVSVD